MGYVTDGSPPVDGPPRRWEGPRGEGWVALQALLLLAWLLVPPLGPPWPGGWRLAAAGLGGLLAAGGGGLALAGAWWLRRQLTPFPRPSDRGRLIDDGPFRLVRHPIYTGLILAAAGLALVTANPSRLAVAGLLVLFFRAKAAREERWLVARFPAYPAYQARVGRLWPRWR